MTRWVWVNPPRSRCSLRANARPGDGVGVALLGCTAPARRGVEQRGDVAAPQPLRRRPRASTPAHALPATSEELTGMGRRPGSPGLRPPRPNSRRARAAAAGRAGPARAHVHDGPRGRRRAGRRRGRRSCAHPADAAGIRERGPAGRHRAPRASASRRARRRRRGRAARSMSSSPACTRSMKRATAVGSGSARRRRGTGRPRGAGPHRRQRRAAPGGHLRAALRVGPGRRANGDIVEGPFNAARYGVAVGVRAEGPQVCWVQGGRGPP